MNLSKEELNILWQALEEYISREVMESHFDDPEDAASRMERIEKTRIVYCKIFDECHEG